MLKLSVLCTQLVLTLTASCNKNYGIEDPFNMDPDNLEKEIEAIKNNSENFAGKSSAFTEDEVCKTAFKDHLKYIANCRSGKIMPFDGTNNVTDDEIQLTLNQGSADRKEPVTENEPIINPEQPIKKLLLAHKEIKDKYPESIVIVRDHEDDHCHVFGEDDCEAVKEVLKDLTLISESGLVRVRFATDLNDTLIPGLVRNGYKVAFAENELSVKKPEEKSTAKKAEPKKVSKKAAKKAKDQVEFDERIKEAAHYHKELETIKDVDKLKSFVNEIKDKCIVVQRSTEQKATFIGAALNENRGRLFVAIKFENGDKKYPFLDDFYQHYYILASGKSDVLVTSPVDKESDNQPKDESKSDVIVHQTENVGEKLMLASCIQQTIKVHKVNLEGDQESLSKYLTDSVGKSREKCYWNVDNLDVSDRLKKAIKHGITLMFEANLLEK